MSPPQIAATVPEAARQYSALGYALAAWPARDGKAPRRDGWGRAAANPARVSPSDNIGVNHGLSGTAALDLDHLDLSLRVLEALGLDLNELTGSTTAWRGRPDRAKLLFRAPSPALGVRKLKVWTEPDAEPVTVLELRGAEEGAQVQDVLPPSRHPDTGKPYELVTPLRAVAELPPMPAQLVDVWTHWKVWEPALRRICGDVRLERETPALRPSPARAREGASVIDAFNARYSLAEMLERNGYERRGSRRWLRPGSTTGAPGIVLLPDERAVYCHGGGALDDGHAHDAFDVFRILEHDGDTQSAVRAAAKDLGMDRLSIVPPITPPPRVQSEAPAPYGPPARRIVLRTIAEIVAEKRCIEWLLPKVLEANVLAVMAGRRGIFKSFIALDWCLRVALAGEPVVVLSGEGGGLGRRMEAWHKAYAPDTPIETLPLRALEYAINLNTPDLRSELVEAVAALPWRPRLILVDTLSKYSAGMDESSNTEVAAYLAALTDDLRDRYGCTVLLVAHAGHGDGKRPRGASALMANPDAEYIVERPEGGAIVTVTRERFKDYPEQPPLAYTKEQIDLGREQDGERVTSLVMRSAELPKPPPRRGLGPHQTKALAALREWHRTNPGAAGISSVTVRALMKEQGIPRQRWGGLLQYLVAIRALTPSIGGYTLDPAALE